MAHLPRPHLQRHDDRESAAEPDHAALPMPVDLRSAALVVLAVIATLALLHWARQVIIPVLLGVMFSYALTPFVDRLEHWRVHRALSAGVLLLAILGGLAYAGISLQDDATALVESLPQAAHKLGRAVGAARAVMAQVARP